MKPPRMRAKDMMLRRIMRCGVLHVSVEEEEEGQGVERRRRGAMVVRFFENGVWFDEVDIDMIDFEL